MEVVPLVVPYNLYEWTKDKRNIFQASGRGVNGICQAKKTFTSLQDSTNNSATRQVGTAVAQWLRYCATNRKVAGSIPDGVIGIFH